MSEDQNINTAVRPRLKDYYATDVRPRLQEHFEYTSPMQLPRIEKITLSMGVGEAKQNSKALDEAVRVRSWARSIRHADPAGALVLPADEIRDFDEHIRYYAYDGPAPRTSFLDASEERRDTADVPPLEGGSLRAQIDALCNRLERQHASAYVVDVTSPDVADAGLCVVKVIAPELCPLDVEHRARLLGSRRLYEVPARLGMRPRRLRFDELNADPHPFP